MKKVDIFCASQASTAICMSMDRPSSSSSSSTISSGSRAIDRHNPIIRDYKRAPRALPLAPCTSELPPINPQPYHLLHKSEKLDPAVGSTKAKANAKDQTKKSSRKLKNKNTSSVSKPAGDVDVEKEKESTDISTVRKSWAKHDDFITPPGSSRYLLTYKDFLDRLSDYDPVSALVPADQPNKSSSAQASSQESTSSKPSSTSNPSEEKPSNQVVVLRVSLHCKGCEGKVRKHLSRMEGVSSYSIDFAAKKVTIVGDVTPLTVLASVSKVKNAQFWTPAATPPAAVSNNSQLKK